MPTQHPRINVALELPLFQCLQALAKRDDVSLSMKVRDLIRDALELTEDAYWDRLGEKRKDTFSKKTALSHDEVWSK